MQRISPNDNEKNDIQPTYTTAPGVRQYWPHDMDVDNSVKIITVLMV